MSFSDFVTSTVQNIGSMFQTNYFNFVVLSFSGGLLWLNLFLGNEMKHEMRTNQMKSILSKLEVREAIV